MLITLEQLRGAWDGLSSHRLRSGLTALGVIFGVAAVVAMASIGEGAKREALRQIELMGASNILIEDQEPEEGEAAKAALEKSAHGITLNDAEALREIIPDARRVVPMKTDDLEVSGGGKRVRLNVVASTSELFALHNMKLLLGRRIDETDEITQRRVCLLGWSARRELFPLVNPIGKDIRVRNTVFTVVGVIERRATGGGEIEGVKLRDENRDIYIPLSVELKLRNLRPKSGSDLTRITVEMNNPDNLVAVGNLIQRTFQRRHRGVADFAVIIPEQLLRQHQATQRIFNIVMGAIASISLMVGGIGIMNIMLASVLERTREIGIRRAIGATQSDITRQFLTEAVILSLFGGIVGVILGIGLARGISIYAGWETAVSIWAVFVAVTVSAGVGVIFGWLPARSAAKLDPITALRYE